MDKKQSISGVSGSSYGNISVEDVGVPVDNCCGKLNPIGRYNLGVSIVNWVFDQNGCATHLRYANFFDHNNGCWECLFGFFGLPQFAGVILMGVLTFLIVVGASGIDPVVGLAIAIICCPLVACNFWMWCVMAFNRSWTSSPYHIALPASPSAESVNEIIKVTAESVQTLDFISSSSLKETIVGTIRASGKASVLINFYGPSFRLSFFYYPCLTMFVLWLLELVMLVTGVAFFFDSLL